MSFLRPELAAALRRQSGTLAGAVTALAGLWVATRGGPVLLILGGALALTGAGFALIEWRRARFAVPVAAPGVVQVDEGQIGYFGTDFGGFVALRELSEVRLLEVRGTAHWQLRQGDGQALLIPHAAAGAEALFDAFAVLPGFDLGALVALGTQPARGRTVWRRPAPTARP